MFDSQFVYLIEVVRIKQKLRFFNRHSSKNPDFWAQCGYPHWLKGIEECLLGKVKGLLELLGSKFSAQTQS